MISLNIVKSFYTFDEIDFKFENIVGYEVLDTKRIEKSVIAYPIIKIYQKG